jgi:hypothetical protein
MIRGGGPHIGRWTQHASWPSGLITLGNGANGLVTQEIGHLFIL